MRLEWRGEIFPLGIDKFSEAICAFANDMPGTGQNGYLLVGSEACQVNISVMRKAGSKMSVIVLIIF